MAQRLTYDAIKNYDGKIENFVITKSLIHAAHNSHSLYEEDRLKQKKESEEEQRLKKDERVKANALKELENKRKEVMREAIKESTRLDEEIQSLKRS